MPWFYVDDGFPDSPKLALIKEKLFLRAVGLWVLAGAWSRRKLTGGLVPDGQVRRLGGTAADAQALVDCGLWERDEAGYRFHDWEEWQETVEELEQQRARERTKKRAWREAKKRTSGTCPPGTPGGHQQVSTGDTGDKQSDVHRGQSTLSPVGPRPVLGSPSPSPSPSDLATLDQTPKPPPRRGAGGSARVPSDADAPPGFAEPSRLERSKQLVADHIGFAAAFERAAKALGFTAAPSLTLREQTAAAEHVAKLAANRPESRDQVAYAVSRAALQGSQDAGKPALVGSLLRSVDPWAPAAGQGAARPRPGRVEPAPGTTSADFSDVSADDFERQLNEIGRPL